MKAVRLLAVGVVVLLALPWGSARAGHGFWSFGFNIGVPVYPRPWCGYPYYYYRPYPVIVEPAPVVVQPAPVVQPVPIVAPAYPAPAGLPAAPVPVTARSPGPESRQADVDAHLAQLSNPDERVRADAAIQLGRMRVQQAADRLETTLAGDSSPQVREAAARALGLIGAPRSLAALQRAAQADGDRDVRTCARFAVDVIQAGGPR